MKVLLPQYEFAPEVVVNINVPVLCFCVCIAIITGVLFGLSPALQLSRAEPERVLQSGKRSMAGTRHSRRTHELLIAGQIALTLLLLAGAGAAIEGFLHLLHVPLGYNPHNVISVWIPLPENAYPAWTDRLAYFEKLLTAVREVPGVTATAISTNATPPDSGYRAHFEILGKPASAEQEIRVELVSPEYFSTLEIPVTQGRLWTNTENRTGAHFVVINQALARVYFPNGDAIGQSIKLPQTHDDSGSTGPSPGLMNTPLQIAGVVADSRNSGLRDPVAPAIYVPYSLSMPAGTQILVRSPSQPLRLLNSIRIALARVNPNQQAARVVSDLDKWISDQPEWQQEHLVAWLFGAFAVLALSLAAVGLYSVVSYAVAQRTNEFGIRMALGAQRSHVLRIVFASMFACVSAGVLTGALLTWVLKSLLATWVGADARPDPPAPRSPRPHRRRRTRLLHPGAPRLPRRPHRRLPRRVTTAPAISISERYACILGMHHQHENGCPMSLLLGHGKAQTQPKLMCHPERPKGAEGSAVAFREESSSTNPTTGTKCQGTTSVVPERRGKRTGL